MQIEPDTEIMQTDFGCQAGLKSREVMRPLTSQAKGIQELIIDSFNHLPQTGQPAPQRFGPTDVLAPLMRGSHQVDLSLDLPAMSWSLSRKALVCYIGAVSRQADAWQARHRCLSSGKHSRGQVLIMGAGRTKAKASHDAQRSDTQQQMKAFVPANPITPPTIRLTCQPAQTTTFGIASDSGGTIQHLVEALLGLQKVDQVQAEQSDLIAVRSYQPIELTRDRAGLETLLADNAAHNGKKSVHLETAPIVQTAPRSAPHSETTKPAVRVSASPEEEQTGKNHPP